MSQGRKSKLTSELQLKFCQGIKLGMTYKLACGFVGISETTLYRWLQEADQMTGKPGKVRRDFREAIKGAESSGAAHSLAVIHRAAEDGTWAAAAWLLERRHCYRRDSAPVVEAIIRDVEAQQIMVDVETDTGRESIIGEIARMPEDLILAALNRKNAAANK